MFLVNEKNSSVIFGAFDTEEKATSYCDSSNNLKLIYLSDEIIDSIIKLYNRKKSIVPPEPAPLKNLRHTIYEFYGDMDKLTAALPELAIVCGTTEEEVIGFVKGLLPDSSAHIAKMLVRHLNLKEEDFHKGYFI